MQGRERCRLQVPPQPILDLADAPGAAQRPEGPAGARAPEHHALGQKTCTLRRMHGDGRRVAAGATQRRPDTVDEDVVVDLFRGHRLALSRAQKPVTAIDEVSLRLAKLAVSEPRHVRRLSPASARR